jgi:drug/metabolite transporter, DME family
LAQLVSLQLSPRLGYVGIGLAAASWGSWVVFLRLAERAQPLSPVLKLFVILAMIGLCLLPLAVRQTLRQSHRRPWQAWALLVLFGATDALNGGLYFSAIQTTTVAVAALTHYLAPLLVALSAPYLLRERRKPGTLLAVALGLLGLATLLAPWQVASQSAPAGLLRGALMGVGSALFYAIGLLLTKRLSASFGGAELLVYHMPSALLLLALFVPQGGWYASTPALSWLLLGAIGPGALAGLVFMRCLLLVPAARAAVLTFVEPLTAIAIAALAWGEPLGLRALVGGAAILAAGYLVVREERATAISGIAPPDCARQSSA